MLGTLEVDFDDGVEDGLDVRVDKPGVDLQVGVEDLGGIVGLVQDLCRGKPRVGEF